MSRRKLILEKGDKVKVLFAAGIYVIGGVESHSDDGQVVIREYDSNNRIIVGDHLYIQLLEN